MYIHVYKYFVYQLRCMARRYGRASIISMTYYVRTEVKIIAGVLVTKVSCNE